MIVTFFLFVFCFIFRTIVLADSVPDGYTINGPGFLPTGGSLSGGNITGILRGKASENFDYNRHFLIRTNKIIYVFEKIE